MTCSSVRPLEQADAGTPTLWSYGYDRLDQLTSATKTDTVTKAVLNNYIYNYDLAGNRTSEQIELGVKKTAYNNLNQIAGRTGGGTGGVLIIILVIVLIPVGRLDDEDRIQDNLKE